MHSWAYGFQTVRAMAAAADLVAQGAVLSNTYVPDSPGGPLTDYAFAVERVLVNHALTADPVPERITVSAPGGPQVPDNLWVEDSVVYRDGQRLIVFLRRYGPGRYTIITAPAMSTFVVDGDQVRPFAPDHGLQDVPGAMARADFLALVGE